MKPSDSSSLAWRQTRWTLLAAVLLGVAMSFLLIFVDLQQTRSNIETSTQELLLTTSNAATQAAYTLDATLAEEVLEGLFAVQAVSSGVLVTERDRVLASRDRRAEQSSPLMGRLLGTELEFSYPLVWQNTYTGDSQEVGELSITLNGAIAARDFTRRVWWELIFGVVRNVLLAFVILYISKYLLTRPLGQLVDQIRNRKREDFTPLKPIPDHESDEIGRVVKSFNQLLESLQQSTRERERLNEVMAHHFQEPARRLVSFAQRLQRSPDFENDSESQLSLVFIKEQSLRLSELVRDVQRYLAIEQLRLKSEKVFPAELFLEVLGDHEEGRKISVEVSGEAVPAWFPARRLREIFSLLLDNALRYGCSAKELKLKVEVVGTPEGTRVFFSDNGPGIAPEYRHQVFGIFERLVPNSPDYPGTGMGLAWIKKVLSQYGGQIELVDTHLGGACFVFELPNQGANDDEFRR
ncbi:HAMP domain-containing sensor histidine kinase [Marinospirillum sp.]|uniref:sensor histidine kinase n=1 Tax=Marinospirillum sp. TaxID=2183934 RepID=UPI0028704981|nr:HAMP domain-containing sensor histidine kinase [Marinospirillum sp.]MDR9467239.1 HAMP domain-containing sensor histidine kinase [Marinospirillum sp.]